MGTNGLLSFEAPYNRWLNWLFTDHITYRYLVAPFWDDVDIRGGRGQISYEIYESGYFLDYISAFIRAQRPSEFQGTWMMVVFWDAVHPYFGASRPEVCKSLTKHSFWYFTFISPLLIGKHISSYSDHRWVHHVHSIHL